MEYMQLTKKRPGPKSPGVKRPGPECQGAKRPGPKIRGRVLGARSSGAKRGRNALVQKVCVRNAQVQNVRG